MSLTCSIMPHSKPNSYPSSDFALKRSQKNVPQETIAADENRFAPELNEKEVIELLENATPGSMKRATKYGMKVYPCKNLPKLYFDNLNIRVSQIKTMQVETMCTFKNYLYIVTSGFFSQNKVENILGAFLMRQLFHSRLLDMR